MTESRHTPGPWNYGGVTHAAHSGGQSIDFPDGSGFLVAVSEADARLIAAAPDLLAALKEALDAHYNGAGKWVKDAHEAIARAEGQS